MPIKPIPEGYHSVTPYLIVNGAAGLIGFLQEVFGAEVKERMERPDGAIAHAEVVIGDSIVMMGEASDSIPPMPTMLYVYVADCDAVYQRALRAGATSIREPRNEFYGDRSGGVKDMCGNQWWIGAHVEDVPPDEMARRMEAASKQQG